MCLAPKLFRGPVIATAVPKCRSISQRLWSHLHTEQSKVSLDQLMIEGEDASALGNLGHVTNTTEQPFTTPFALQLRVKDGAITNLQLCKDTYAVANAFGVWACNVLKYVLSRS
jgi:hypothetical protein